MIETNVPDDIRQYKTKLIGPLTLRQLICIGIAMVVDIILFSIVTSVIHNSVDTKTIIVILLIVVDLPIMAFTKTVQGIPMEEYVKDYMAYNFMTPLHRYENTEICSYKEEVLTDKEKKKKAKQHKANLKQNPTMKPYA